MQIKLVKPILFFFCTMFYDGTLAQQQAASFWDKVQVGGGVGLGIGNGFTNLALSPSAIYNFNSQLSAGAGLQYSYLRSRDIYSSHMYGGSLIGLYQPLPEIQLSVELEQLRVNYQSELNSFSEDFWNTGLFLGAGYRFGAITFGARYNVLHKSDRGVYADALMPFMRVFF